MPQRRAGHEAWSPAQSYGSHVPGLFSAAFSLLVSWWPSSHLPLHLALQEKRNIYDQISAADELKKQQDDLTKRLKSELQFFSVAEIERRIKVRPCPGLPRRPIAAMAVPPAPLVWRLDLGVVGCGRPGELSASAPLVG